MQCCGWEFNHTKGRKFKRTIPTETITWPRFTYIRQGRNFNSAFSHLNYCICRRGTAILLLHPLLFFFLPCVFSHIRIPSGNIYEKFGGGDTREKGEGRTALGKHTHTGEGSKAELRLQTTSNLSFFVSGHPGPSPSLGKTSKSASDNILGWSHSTQP